MARVAFPLVLQSPSTGSAIVGATATITQHVVGGSLGSGAPATIYLAETGSSAVVGNQIATDNTGRWTQGQAAGYAQYWLEEGTYDIVISGSGLASYAITRELVSGAANVCRAYLSATPILGVGWQRVPVDTVTLDSGNNFDTTNHRYTVPVRGYYLVHGAISVQYNNNPQLLQAGIYKNGTLLPGQSPDTYRGLTTGDGLMARITDLQLCATGDHLEMWLYNGGPINSVQLNGPGPTYLTVARLRG